MADPSAAHLEIEVKVHLPGLDALHTALVTQGARLVQPRTFEENWRFDTPDGALRRKGEILRLRRSADVRITHKRRSLPAGELHGRPETEITVNDCDAARALLERLGFVLVATYEKYREVYRLGPVAVALDELPLGTFAELEGPSTEAIQDGARRLGLEWSATFQGSYLSIFHWLRTRRGLPARDLTFGEFVGITLPELGLPDSAAEGADERR